VINDSGIPVLFTGSYHGEKYKIPYLDETILRAKASGNYVILLGEGSSRADIQYPMENYLDAALRFDEAYVHMATYNEKYARLTFRRHFVIREFMRCENIERLFLCENDVLLFCNINDVLGDYKLSAFSTAEQQNPYDWCSSAHCSLWKKDDYYNFTEFAIDSYKTKLTLLEEKWRYQQENNLPGGISDMAFLYLFAQENKIASLLKISENSVFDDNISTSTNSKFDEFAMDYPRVKKIRLIADNLCFFANPDNKPIKIQALHLSGDAKHLVPLFNKQFFLRYSFIRNILVSIVKVENKIKREKFTGFR